MKERNTIVSAGTEGEPCSWARRTTGAFWNIDMVRPICI